MIYVMSDIHGNIRRFKSVMKQIRLRPEDTLYVLGDVVDRHPDGIRILKKIMSMPNAIMLLGNHEYMMLRALGCPFPSPGYKDDLPIEAAVRHWYRNGGEVTHKHWKRIRKSTRREILRYLHALNVNLDIEVNGVQYKLVHAAPTEEMQYYDWLSPDPVHFSVWKRWQAEETQHGDYTMVFGHTPTREYAQCSPMQIWYAERRIGIDCGSGYPEDPDHPLSEFGRLACLRLDDGQVFYSEEARKYKTE